MKATNRLAPLLRITVTTSLVGFIAGWIVASSNSAKRLDRVVAMSWGDGKYGPAFYGAHVYIVPQGSAYSVRAEVFVGRGNGYFQDCGELDRVATEADAVARWGTIDWRADGLHIGRGTNHYFLPQAQLESHR